MKNKNIHFVSLGCPKNLIDSEVMASLLIKSGFGITPSAEEADIIIINTCAFILPAKEESIEEILRMAEWKKDGRCRHLVVTGCLPQRYGTILKKEIPEVDLLLGTGEIPRIADFIRNLENDTSSDRQSFIGEPSFLMDSTYSRLLFTSGCSAYLKIAEGCSNCCSYCVIPSVRGKYRSREIDDILKETEMLAKAGIKEINITAQDTTLYGSDLKGKPGLSLLLREMASIDGIRWIRLLYAYPAYLTGEILQTIAGEEKICNYIDIPIQHIDDDILKAMNRKGESKYIRDTLNLARKIIPGVALRTSLIVGFPGETPEKFDKLLDFVKWARFENLGVFEYSREEGTAAADFPAQIPEKKKERRKNVLMEEQSRISYEINQSRIGDLEDVLIEDENNHPDFPYIGRIRGQAPEIDGITYVSADDAAVVGDIIPCRITSADVYDLFAEQTDN
ncbi:MAG: 30S ribosomal protein S12 methylthiotransferase RimO [Planctomycetaceae bacterium]|nr:MAG: 30S ribosomal protein S12 methylthiotransferase RimO [Planctomycetaceae bacterium]